MALARRIRIGTGHFRMPKLIYRVISACGGLGCGYPAESLEAALRGRVDAIVCDAGSANAGPYSLGSGTGYFQREAVKDDYLQMVAAGQRLGCPVIVGNSGIAGGDRNLDGMLRIAQEVFSELEIRDAKVAAIAAQINPAIVIEEFRRGVLRPVGCGPELNEEALQESIVVGQMGVDPFITALERGVQYILAGRCCGAALFAADMIRCGIDAGLAYHVGHVLTRGALACDPGSLSDCLVAEIYDDSSAIFIAPNRSRRCTPLSIAALSCYGEAHPLLQYYPEGILATGSTQFFSESASTAGIRNSRFLRADRLQPWSIKLEGARRIGAQKISLIYVDPKNLLNIPANLVVYGRNGVNANPVRDSERELGVIIETVAKEKEIAEQLASLLARHLDNCEVSGRGAMGGNLAHPLSPSMVSFVHHNGLYGVLVPGGTRDAAFMENYPTIKAAVTDLVETKFPHVLARASYTITEADQSNPVILLRTVDDDQQQLASRHAQQIAYVGPIGNRNAASHMNVDGPDCYVWSLHHLLQNEDVIKQKMFPITYYRANGVAWQIEGADRPVNFYIAGNSDASHFDSCSLSLISDAPPEGKPLCHRRLKEMATVIRSGNAGISRLTIDIVFKSAEDYEAALRSNRFTDSNVATVLGVRPDRVIGTYFVDKCDTIKITIDRPCISASLNERDVSGVQQQSAIESMNIPIYDSVAAETTAISP